jgi:hypothetical protein
MALREAAFSVVCVAVFLAQEISAQEGNGVVSREVGGQAASPGTGSMQGPVPIGGPWNEFLFADPGSFATGCQGGACVPSSGGNSVFADDPPWTFTAPAEGATLTVTDVAWLGDQFEIFDFGTQLGATSTPQDLGGDCGDDPEVCITDPRVSQGLFSLSPGPHEITIRAKLSPFGVGAAHFRVDLSAALSPSDFYTLLPCRVVDTRLADGPHGGPALGANELRDSLLRGQCGIPADARAVSFNITVVGPTAPGFLRVFAAGTVEPPTSTINFSAGQTRANNGIAALIGSGMLSVRASLAAGSGTVHLVLDVNGYFR